MRTTLNLDADLIQALMHATQARTKTEAITQAMTELIRRKKLDKLKALGGTLHLRLNWRKHEKAELRRQSRLKRQWHGSR